MLASLVLFVPTIFYLLRSKARELRNKSELKMVIAVCATGLFAFFMLSNASGFIWNNVNTLQKTQFPWRFMTVATLMTAGLMSFAISLLFVRFQKFQRIILLPAGLIIFCIFFFVFTPIIRIAGPLAREKN